MMAEIAVFPSKEDHLSPVIAVALDEIEKCQVHYQVGPMGTSLEGHPDQVFLALRKVYEKLSHSQDRLFMTVSLDSRETKASSLVDRVTAVESLK